MKLITLLTLVSTLFFTTCSTSNRAPGNDKAHLIQTSFELKSLYNPQFVIKHDINTPMPSLQELAGTTEWFDHSTSTKRALIYFGEGKKVKDFKNNSYLIATDKALYGKRIVLLFDGSAKQVNEDEFLKVSGL